VSTVLVNVVAVAVKSCGTDGGAAAPEVVTNSRALIPELFP